MNFALLMIITLRGGTVKVKEYQKRLQTFIFSPQEFMHVNKV